MEVRSWRQIKSAAHTDTSTDDCSSIVTLQWFDLSLIHSSASFSFGKKNSPHFCNPLKGGKVFECHLDPSLSPSVPPPHSSLTHAHVTPPRPALMLAILFVGEWRLLLSETELSSTGTGRTEGRRSSPDKPAALRSGALLGLLPPNQRPEAYFPEVGWLTWKTLRTSASSG